MHLLFLRRDECGYSDRAEDYLRRLFRQVTVVRSSRIGDKLDPELRSTRFDVVFAFRSHIIMPNWLIDQARVALNFHPGPPERPGIGCVNFALYEGDEQYGSTCHYAVQQIDAGPIVSVRYFPVHESDSIASVLDRSYDYLLCQLYDVAPIVAAGEAPQPCDAHWTRKATTKADLDRLQQIPPDASAEEIRRRVRATSFGNYGPHVTIHGARFQFSKFAS